MMTDTQEKVDRRHNPERKYRIALTEEEVALINEALFGFMQENFDRDPDVFRQALGIYIIMFGRLQAAGLSPRMIPGFVGHPSKK